jgi:hypothetical protein
LIGVSKNGTTINGSSSERSVDLLTCQAALVKPLSDDGIFLVHAKNQKNVVNELSANTHKTLISSGFYEHSLIDLRKSRT